MKRFALMTVLFLVFALAVVGGIGGGRYDFGLWNTGFGLLDPGDDRVPIWDDSADSMTWQSILHIDTTDSRVGIGDTNPRAKLTVEGGMFVMDTVTITDGDTTPDVSDGNIFATSSNTGATAITDLDNPQIGQIVRLIGGSDTNSSTIADSGNFNLSASWTAGLDDVLVLYVQADNDYIELSRVDN